MADFASEHANIISECCSDMINIERAIFITGSSFTKGQKLLLSTYSIVMLYSIWEGFVTKSFQLYADYINSQHVTYNEVNESILIYNMESRFKQFKNYPLDMKKRGKFFTDLYTHCQSNVCEIPTNVNTESNVSFKVLNKLLLTFGLETFPEDWSDYKTPKTNLKATLNDFLRYRHAIAHGGDISNEEAITQDVYSRYRSLVRDLMYGMHSRFLDGISNKTYKKDIREQ